MPAEKSISDIIKEIKGLYRGKSYLGVSFSPENTRDNILYGDPDKTCTGIVTTCWASVEVIEKAHKRGANLIIVHEALFWNHGDKTEWLLEDNNQTYLAKVELLEKYGIVVWRNHDHIHSGMKLDNGDFADGIMYGLVDELGWHDYLVGDYNYPLEFSLPSLTVREIATHMNKKFNLNGIKIVGKPESKVDTMIVGLHAVGKDNYMITMFEEKKFQLMMLMEVVDSTVIEYVHDSSLLGFNKSIISPGHFNAEEPGMKHMASYVSEKLKLDVNISFIQSGDMYHYVLV